MIGLKPAAVSIRWIGCLPALIPKPRQPEQDIFISVKYAIGLSLAI
jgi:hypothetical protein